MNEEKLNNIPLGSEIQIKPKFYTGANFSGSVRYEGVEDGRLKYSWISKLNHREYSSACLGGMNDVRKVPVVDVSIKILIHKNSGIINLN